MASSPPNSQRSNASETSARPIQSTPLRRSSRPPTPRKTIPGMIQPSADSQTTIPLPQQSTSGTSRVQNRAKQSQTTTSAPGLDSSQHSAPASSLKRKRPSKASQPPREDIPPEDKMNEDSEDGLSKRQKLKRAEALQVSSNNEEENPEYTPAREYFGDPWKSKSGPEWKT
ncbi:uncharacterized protein MELLADRAFT_89201 [Melampsora larici-populina 98AG31]|uniref:Uncharacterized protein n=1 Tax=Melampsora larici-populina (strain 98AG31 / pathotype 3-4-7) TaxID=747676 RepID=F4R5B2_MELLP|nr:uncharacterized protein MELLADRAFT_89201 [Melampsora larici-populina 98AG31]EGG12293.1 hypothetical protein MELLADRAFT_89201 [Melampsora larici-populina 98AG31]